MFFGNIFLTTVISEILAAGTAYKLTNDVIDYITKELEGRIEKEDQLSYANFLERIIDIRPKYPNPKRAAVLRTPFDSNYKRLIFLFLDEKDEIICYPNGNPYGNILLVKNLDKEIDEQFGDTDFLFVE